MEFEFSQKFSKNAQISNWLKIRRVQTELIHADGRTDGQTERYDEANTVEPLITDTLINEH
jgi:hypothetical protein